MQNTEKAITRFREFLKAKGLRHTRDRDDIVSAVFSEHGHFRVDDLVMRLVHGSTRTSRATVYRTLPLLIESRLIRSVGCQSGDSYFEHIYEHQHHDHLACERCGRVIEFYHEELESLQDVIATQFGFHLVSHLMVLRGLCNHCHDRG